MKDFISKVGKGRRGSRDLAYDEAHGAMECLLGGEATAYQIGAFLLAMRVKGESVDELAAFTSVARRYNLSLDIDGKRFLDIPSYSGKKRTLHLLVLSAILISAAGQPVIIHGFKDSSPKIGTGRILDAMGITSDLGIDGAAYLLNKEGFGYIDINVFNQPLYKLLLLRDELGVRTFINTISRLTNPANATRHIIGVSHPPFLKRIGEILNRLGAEEAILLKGVEAEPELYIFGMTMGASLKGSIVRPEEFSPSDFGISDGKEEDMLGDTPPACRRGREAEIQVIKGILENRIDDKRRDWAIMNGALGLYVAGRVSSLKEGAAIIRETLSSGEGYQKYLSILERQEEFLQKRVGIP